MCVKLKLLVFFHSFKCHFWKDQPISIFPFFYINLFIGAAHRPTGQQVKLWSSSSERILYSLFTVTPLSISTCCIFCVLVSVLTGTPSCILCGQISLNPGQNLCPLLVWFPTMFRMWSSLNKLRTTYFIIFMWWLSFLFNSLKLV